MEQQDLQRCIDKCEMVDYHQILSSRVSSLLLLLQDMYWVRLCSWSILIVCVYCALAITHWKKTGVRFLLVLFGYIIAGYTIERTLANDLLSLNEIKCMDNRIKPRLGARRLSTEPVLHQECDARLYHPSAWWEETDEAFQGGTRVRNTKELVHLSPLPRTESRSSCAFARSLLVGWGLQRRRCSPTSTIRSVRL